MKYVSFLFVSFLFAVFGCGSSHSPMAPTPSAFDVDEDQPQVAAKRVSSSMTVTSNRVGGTREVLISSPDVVALSGGFVEVPVRIDKIYGRTVLTWDLEVEFDNHVLDFLGVGNGDAWGDGAITGHVKDGNTLDMVALSQFGITRDGELAVIVFRVKDDALTSRSTIRLHNAIVFDENVRRISTATRNGSVDVTQVETAIPHTLLDGPFPADNLLGIVDFDVSVDLNEGVLSGAVYFEEGFLPSGIDRFFIEYTGPSGDERLTVQSYSVWYEDGRANFSFSIPFTGSQVQNDFWDTESPRTGDHGAIRVVYHVDPTAPEPEHQVLPGDVSGNGDVHAFDVRLIRLHISGDVPFQNQWQLDAADMDHDGDIDEDDVQLVLDRVFGA